MIQFIKNNPLLVSIYLLCAFTIGLFGWWIINLIWYSYHPPKGWEPHKSYAELCKPQFHTAQHFEVKTDEPWYEDQETERYTVCVDSDGRNPTIRTQKKTYILKEVK